MPQAALKDKDRITLKDVASYLGLSAATVSIVLSGSPRSKALRPETRERVRQAAADLGYRPNGIARSLRVKRTQLIGVLMPRINSHYASLVMEGLDDYLRARGYSYLASSHSHEPQQAQEQVQTLIDRQVDGLVLIAAPEIDSHGVPTVSVGGRTAADAESEIGIDHGPAVDQALDHLYSLGHRRIAFIKGSPGNPDTAGRWRAVQRACQRLGLEIEPRLVRHLWDGCSPSPRQACAEGFRLGQSLLSFNMPSSSRPSSPFQPNAEAPFTALFAFNDHTAIGAMRAFVEAGFRVPWDFSVVGFDDIDAAEYQHPPLTTVRQPLEDMGELAGRLLLDKLDPGSASLLCGPRRLEADLQIRASTGPAFR